MWGERGCKKGGGLVGERGISIPLPTWRAQEQMIENSLFLGFHCFPSFSSGPAE